MTRPTSRFNFRLQGALTYALLLGAIALAGTTNFNAIQLEPTSGDTVAFRVLNTSATPVFSISNSGTVTTSGGGFSLANDESLNTDTDAIFDFTRNDAGTVTLTASDDDATAAITLDAGGASAITIGSADVTGVTLTHDGGSLSTATASTLILTALTTADAVFQGADAAGAANTTLDTTGAGAITIGSADVTAVTVTTDSTGTAEVVLPAGSIDSTELLDGTILAADIGTAGVDVIQICGDATTVNNNTVYYGPSQVVSATTASGMACDTTAAGNTTEATADAPAYAAQAFQVRGMTCRTVDLGTSTTFTLRSAEAATTPSVVATIADNILVGVADVQTTTAIASAATVAVAVASAGDLPTSAFVCNIYVTY